MKAPKIRAVVISATVLALSMMGAVRQGHSFDLSPTVQAPAPAPAPAGGCCGAG